MPRYLVTGGAGFIGSNLVARLLDLGHEVVAVDDLSSGRPANLEGLEGRFTLLEGSICDPELMSKACLDVEFVLHQAAVPSVQRSIENPTRTAMVNAQGTMVTLDSARRAGVRRVVLAGSSSVYGDHPGLPRVETMPPSPISPYAASKVAAEWYARSVFVCHGLETVVLRYFNVYGPRQDPASHYSAVIPRFCAALLEGRNPTIYGDGLQTRDFTNVADVVEANLLACMAEDAPGRVFNVGAGGTVSLLDLLAALARAAGVDCQPDHEPNRAGDVMHSHADISAAREILGFVPRVSLEEGLAGCLDWYRRELGRG